MIDICFCIINIVNGLHCWQCLTMDTLSLPTIHSRSFTQKRISVRKQSRPLIGIAKWSGTNDRRVITVLNAFYWSMRYLNWCLLSSPRPGKLLWTTIVLTSITFIGTVTVIITCILTWTLQIIINLQDWSNKQPKLTTLNFWTPADEL